MRPFRKSACLLVLPAIAIAWTGLCPGLAEEKITCYADAIERQPGYEVYTDGEGRFTKMGEYQKALDDPARAKTLPPAVAARALNNRAYAYHNQGKNEKAIELLNQAIALDPKCVKALYTRAQTYESMGEWKKEIDDCARLIELAPQNAVFYFSSAVAHGQLKEWRKAVEDSTRAIEKNPNFANAYRYRGYAYEKLGETNLAREDKEKGDNLGRAED